MKKFVIAAFAAAISSAAFAAGSEKAISFSNELSSDIVHIVSPKDSNKDSHTRFAGVSDEVVADYEGDILKVGVDATASFESRNEWDDDAGYDISDWDVDFYVEFNPFKIVGFGFSDELYTEGSYLPVLDDNINAGNYSTTGFAVLIRPVDGLTFGAGLDFPAYWFGDDEKAYELAFGVDYTSDPFSIGGSLRHIGKDDAFQFGAYASLKMIDKLVINVGFTHSEDGEAGLDEVTFVNPNYGYLDDDGNWVSIRGSTGIYGENILSAGVTYDAGKFALGADLAFNFDGDYSAYDFYTAVDFNMGLTEKLILDVKGLLLMDFGDVTVQGSNGWRKLDPTIGVYPKVEFALNDHHTLAAGIIVQMCTDSDYGYTEVALPVSWKYTY